MNKWAHSDDLFLLVLILIADVFQGISTFPLSDQICEHKVVNNIPYQLNIHRLSSDDSSFMLVLLICVFSVFFLVSLAGILSVLLIFSKN